MCSAVAIWFASLTRSEWFDLISTVVGTVALAAAIGIAIHEHLRATGADRKRANDFRSAVRVLVVSMNALARETEARETAGDTQESWEAWQRSAADVRRALEALLPSAPPSPRVITAVASMVRRLEHSELYRDIAFSPGAHVGHVRAVRVDLESALDIMDREN